MRCLTGEASLTRLDSVNITLSLLVASEGGATTREELPGETLPRVGENFWNLMSSRPS